MFNIHKKGKVMNDYSIDKKLFQNTCDNWFKQMIMCDGRLASAGQGNFYRVAANITPNCVLVALEIGTIALEIFNELLLAVHIVIDRIPRRVVEAVKSIAGIESERVGISLIEDVSFLLLRLIVIAKKVLGCGSTATVGWINLKQNYVWHEKLGLINHSAKPVDSINKLKKDLVDISQLVDLLKKKNNELDQENEELFMNLEVTQKENEIIKIENRELDEENDGLLDELE